MAEDQYQVGDPEPIEKLYNIVKDRGLYTKSFNEFKTKYSDENNMNKLFNVVSGEGLYTKSRDEFFSKYATSKKKELGSFGSLPSPFKLQSPAPANTLGVPESFTNYVDPKVKEAEEYLGGHLEGADKDAEDYAQKAASKKLAEKIKYSQDPTSPTFGQSPSMDDYKNMVQESKGALLQNPDKLLTVVAKNKEATNPEQAKKIYSNLYRLKAQSLATDEESKAKIDETSRKIESGEYPVINGQPVRKMGFVESIKQGWNEKNEAFDRYDLLKTPEGKAKVIAGYEDELKNTNRLEVPGVPDGMIERVASGLSGMPLKVLVVGGLVSAVGQPELAQPAAAAVGAIDFGIMGGAHKHKEAYMKARLSGKSEEEATAIADQQMTIGTIAGAVTGAAFSLAPSANLTKILPKSGIQNVGRQIMHNLGEEVKSGVAVGGLSALSKFGENIAVSQTGEIIDPNEGVLDAFKGMVELHFANAAVMRGAKAVRKLGGELVNKAKIALAKIPKEELQKVQAEDIELGSYTKEDADVANAKIDKIRPAVEGLPENTAPEAIIKAADKIERRNKLEGELETVDKALHPEIKEKIKAVNEDIVELSKQKAPKEEEPIVTENEKASAVSEAGSVGVVDVLKDVESTTKAIEELSTKTNESWWDEFGTIKGKTIIADLADKFIDKNPVTNGFKDTIGDKAFNEFEKSGQLSKLNERFIDLNKEKLIAEAYHKAKKDGSNPELVKAVEQSLKEQPTINEQTKEATKVPNQAEAESADIGKVGEVEQGTKEFTTKSGKQKVRLENGELLIKDAKTGEDVSAKTKKKAVLEYIDEHDFTKGEIASIPSEGIRSETELKSHIAETSSNPYELAELYVNEEPTNQPLSTKERMIADYGIGKIKQASYAEFGDRNNIGMSKAKAYFNKEGRSLDVIAKEMSDHYGVEIEPSDLIEFIDRFPNGEKQALREVESDVAVSAANKFKKITGIDINNEIADRIINKEFNKLSKAEQELAQNDYETAQQLQDEYWNAYEQTNGFAEKSTDSQTKQAEKAKKQIDTHEDFEKELYRIIKGESGNAKIGEGAESDISEPVDKNSFKDTETALSTIREHFKGDPFYERATSFLEPILKANKNIKIDTETQLQTGIRGFATDEGTIQLNFRDVKDKNILYSTALHEMLHTVTVAEIKKNEAFRGELDSILSDVRKALGVETNEILIATKAQELMNADKYGALNAREMLAEVFTNKKFYDYLSKIEYKGRNLLEHIIERIVAFFNKEYGAVFDAKSKVKAKDMAEFVTQLTENLIGKKEGKIERSPEVEKLEAKRDAEISKLMKPEVKMELVSVDDLVNSKDPIAAREKHTEIKDKYKELRKLIDCLWLTA